MRKVLRGIIFLSITLLGVIPVAAAGEDMITVSGKVLFSNGNPPVNTMIVFFNTETGPPLTLRNTGDCRITGALYPETAVLGYFSLKDFIISEG